MTGPVVIETVARFHLQSMQDQIGRRVHENLGYVGGELIRQYIVDLREAYELGVNDGFQQGVLAAETANSEG